AGSIDDHRLWRPLRAKPVGQRAARFLHRRESEAALCREPADLVRLLLPVRVNANELDPFRAVSLVQLQEARRGGGTNPAPGGQEEVDGRLLRGEGRRWILFASGVGER